MNPELDEVYLLSAAVLVGSFALVLLEHWLSM